MVQQLPRRRQLCSMTDPVCQTQNDGSVRPSQVPGAEQVGQQQCRALIQEMHGVIRTDLVHTSSTRLTRASTTAVTPSTSSPKLSLTLSRMMLQTHPGTRAVTCQRGPALAPLPATQHTLPGRTVRRRRRQQRCRQCCCHCGRCPCCRRYCCRCHRQCCCHRCRCPCRLLLLRRRRRRQSRCHRSRCRGRHCLLLCRGRRSSLLQPRGRWRLRRRRRQPRRCCLHRRSASAA